MSPAIQRSATLCSIVPMIRTANVASPVILRYESDDELEDCSRTTAAVNNLDLSECARDLHELIGNHAKGPPRSGVASRACTGAIAVMELSWPRLADMAPSRHHLAWRLHSRHR